TPPKTAVSKTAVLGGVRDTHRWSDFRYSKTPAETAVFVTGEYRGFLKKFSPWVPRTTIESNNLRVSYTDKTIESISDNLATLIDSNKRLENKVDLVSSNMKTVILDTQLHQAVLADTLNIMKDFMQYVIPASLTASRAERSSLVHVANEYYNRLHIASSRLINGYQLNQLNHQVQLMSTSLITNTVQTDQQSMSIYKSTENAK
ncbi:unnamed protein product, partial [Rotaria magnacalcarata]